MLCYNGGILAETVYNSLQKKKSEKFISLDLVLYSSSPHHRIIPEPQEVLGTLNSSVYQGHVLG